VFGTTPAAIHANFPTVVYNNLNTSAAATRLAHFSAQDVQDLMLAYARNNRGNTTPLIALIKVKAPAQLARFTTAANNAVAGYTGTSMPMQNKMYLRPQALPPPVAPAPTVDMTLQEIYLEFRTATAGSLSVNGAIAETIQFAGPRLLGWFGAGYSVGTVFNWLIQTYAPNTYDAIGGTLDGMIQNFFDAVNNAIADGKDMIDIMNEMGLVLGDFWTIDPQTGAESLGDFGILFDVDLSLDLCVNPGDC
jgi:hypothetical protein